MIGRVVACGLAAVALGAVVVSGAAAAELKPAAPTTKRSFIAKVVTPVPVTSAPGSGRRLMRLGVHAPFSGGPTQLMIVGTASRSGVGYLKVALPKRPNGSSGWVKADDVLVSSTSYRVIVDTRTRRVTLTRAGKPIRSFRAVVGAPGTPTPTGLFAVSEIVAQPNPRGFYGPLVMTLTAFSNVLESFAGGPGRVAIHGRGGASLKDPLGSARSHGCVRIDNGQISYLAARISPGTPVLIR